MANVHIADEIVSNILSRLPGKPLLRFRCVSTRWNHLISDPYFMKSRSRRMMLFSYPLSLFVIDDNVPVEDKAHSAVRVPITLYHDKQVSILGTFNGIVIFSFTDYKSFYCKLTQYNPLTCASKILLEAIPYYRPFVFGFFETADDLKIVRLEAFSLYYLCDVFDLKTNSRAKPRQRINRDFEFHSKYTDVGVFLNGFLYWRIRNRSSSDLMLGALNVKDMVFSKIKQPTEDKYGSVLIGSLDGCLCMINRIESNRFDVWLMNNEHGVGSSWFTTHSFTLGPQINYINPLLPACILGNGEIVFTCYTSTGQVCIYDISKGIHRTLEGLAPIYSRIGIDCHRSRDNKCNDVLCMEYVESLVSPLDICFS